MIISKSKSLTIILVILILATSLVIYFNKSIWFADGPVIGLSKEELSSELKSVKQESTDLFICSNTTDEQVKAECAKSKQLEMAVNSLKIENCDSLDVTVKNTCLEKQQFLKAITDEDEKYCDDKSKKEDNKNCFDQYYFSLALKKAEVSYCEKLSEKDDIKKCLSYIEKVNPIKN